MSNGICDDLNDSLKSEPTKGIFYGGQGVVIRNLNDGLETIEDCMKQELKVVPGTFWHNDIWPPNQIYPASTDIMKGDDIDGNWLTPTLAVAIGPEHFNCLFNTADLQDKNWIGGVWYAHDSNSCDKRGLHSKSNTIEGAPYEGYDAPYEWIDLLNPPGFRDPEKRGSGTFEPGNPSSFPGGGTGVHVSSNYYDMSLGANQTITQIDGKNVGRSLVGDYTCQINYHDWNPATAHEGYDAINGWFAWIKVFAASATLYHQPIEAWTADLAMGWLNNPRPMITLQNALWQYRNDWCNGNSQPPDPNSPTHYWGWNEIPFSKVMINDPKNWTCFVIVLPPGLNSLAEALTKDKAKANLVDQLNTYWKKYNLEPGKSQVVVARQVINHVPEYADGEIWMRWFFVEPISIGSGWSIDDDGVIHTM